MGSCAARKARAGSSGLIAMPSALMLRLTAPTFRLSRPGEGRAIGQLQLLPLYIQPADLRLDEGHPGAIAQLAQVDLDDVTLIDAGDQGRHHPGIQG